METRDEQVRRLVAEEIKVVDYDAAWPESFRQERDHLLSCVPAGFIRRIEHIGSTAVPGLAAKPIVDLLVEVSDLQNARTVLAPILQAQGYEYVWRPTWGDEGGPCYAWFIRRDAETGVRTHHIHMVDKTFVSHWDSLLFRDYLIEHPDTARDYESLKRRLAAASRHDRAAYTNGKAGFIREVTALAKQRA